MQLGCIIVTAFTIAPEGFEASTVPMPSYTVAEREILAWLYPSAGAWLTWAKRERNAEIVRRHAKGETLAALAKELGISEQRVWRIVKRYG